MRRREFIGLVGAAALRPLAARAQSVRKLGVLMSIGESDPDSKPRVDAFLRGLQDLGWRDGENIHIEYRWAAGRHDLTVQYAQELVALAPDAIVANGTFVVAELKPLTRSIPIVCALVIDPVGLGLIASLSRPGGNITGFTFIDPPLIGKWTALLKDAAPDLHRAALLYNPQLNPWYTNFMRELAADPHSVAMELLPTVIATVADLQTKIPALAHPPATGLITGPESFMLGHMHELAEIAAANRLPGISVYRKFVTEGGLMSYGPDVPDIFRRSAGYVDRILRGANPAELPVQQPTKYEFVVSQQAAKALGLALSPTLLSLADEVIE
jgi:putative tryptophan/tyrosine transport system substrate-binding protein